MQIRILLLPVMMMACTPPSSTGSAAPSQGADGQRQVVGTVRVVGSAPVNIQVVVQDTTGRATQIEGPLVGEIRRLSGAQVEVRGRMNRGALIATGYDIRSVNGAPVQMGIVERAADGSLQLRKSNGEVISLLGATTQFRVGQKVWVQGLPTVRVQSYGVITP